MKLRIYNNLAVLDENDKVIFFIPEPGKASINEFDAPEFFDERIKLAEKVVEVVNKS